MAITNSGRPSPYVFAGTSVYDPPSGPGGKVLVDQGQDDFTRGHISVRLPDDPSLGWQALTSGRVTVYPIAGTHESMLKAPAVEQIVEVLATGAVRT